MPEVAVREFAISRNDLDALSLLIQQLKHTSENQMTSLPIDRAMNIYGALADRSEARGVRDQLSKHLMKRYAEGEKDEHRLTVEGLSYLRDLYREIDSRS